jgi:hypothetical protein
MSITTTIQQKWAPSTANEALNPQIFFPSSIDAAACNCFLFSGRRLGYATFYGVQSVVGGAAWPIRVSSDGE